MNYFSILFARGVADQLIETGHLKVASENDLVKVSQIADYVGSCIEVDVSDPSLPPDVGYEVADAILKHAADSGALVTGNKPEQANTPENAASQVGSSAAMDQEERPEGSYLEGVGKSKLNTPKGHTGEQEEHPKSPSDEQKSNSAIEDREKSATIQAILKKLSGDTGALVTGDKPEQANTPENAAAQVGGPAAMDQEERPEGSYLEGVGKTKLDTAKGHTGAQEEHPKSPSDEQKSNSAIEDREKSASPSPAYLHLFEETASQVVPKLAVGATETEKIAAVKACMGLSVNERTSYIANFNKEASAKRPTNDSSEILSRIANLISRPS